MRCLLKITTNHDVYRRGVTMTSIGMNQQQVMQQFISCNKVRHSFIKVKRNWYDDYPFESIETFNDVAVKNDYQIVKAQGGDVDALLAKYKDENRDNSHTNAMG